MEVIKETLQKGEEKVGWGEDGSVSLSWLFLRSQVYCFSSCCGKTPDKVSMRCEGLISASSLRIQFVMAGKAWQRQVLAAAGHVASSGRKESDHRCSAHSLIFIQPRTAPPHRQGGSSPFR